MPPPAGAPAFLTVPDQLKADVNVRLLSHDTSERSSQEDWRKDAEEKQVVNTEEEQVLGDEDHPKSAKKQQLWTPFFLHRWVIFCFVFAALAMLAALEVLNSKSVKEQGIATPRPSLHYLWTFAPTAFLTILAAFWNQVDVQARRNAPLVRMSKGKVTAPESMLADYLSPWDPMSLVMALNNKDYQVSLSVLASLVLRVLIVLSTGLFVLRYPPLAFDTTLTQLDDFDLSNFDGPSRSISQVVSDAFAPSFYNLSYPDGTTSKYAVQRFTAQASSGLNMTYEAEVNYIGADLDCEDATWTYTDADQPYADPNVHGGRTQFDFASKSWSTSNFTMETTGINGQVWDNLTSQRTIVGETGIGWLSDHSMMNASCTNSKSQQEENCFIVGFGCSLRVNDTAPENPQIPSRTSLIDDSNNPVVPRPTVLIGRQVGFTSDGKPTSYQSIKVTNFTVFLCKPSITVGKALITTIDDHTSTQGGINVTKILSADSGETRGVSAFTFAMRTRDAVREKSQIMNTMLDGFFGATKFQSGATNATQFLEPSYLLNMTKRTFQRTAAQYARQALARPNVRPLPGRVSVVGPRLVIEALTLRIMDALLIVLALSALSLCLFHPFPGMARDYGSIGGLALLLAQSPTLTRLLSGLGASRLSQIRTWLRGYRFHLHRQVTAMDRSWHVVAEVDETIPDGKATSTPKEMKWWRPAIFGTTLRTLTVLVPLLLVGGLEIAFRKSNSNQGFDTVPQGGYLKYTWAFGPAIVMVLTASVFSMLDFSTRTFQPYHALSGPRNASFQDLFETPFGYFAAHSLGRSIKRKQWALSSTSLAVCVSPLLTVAVSGLFQAQSTPIFTKSQVEIGETFLPSSVQQFGLQYDPSSSLPGMIFLRNISYPSLTHENLVFPNFTITNTSTSGARFQSLLPAARVDSECKIFEGDNFELQSAGEELMTQYNKTWRYWSVWVKLGQTCHIGNDTMNTTDVARYNISELMPFNGTLQYLSALPLEPNLNCSNYLWNQGRPNYVMAQIEDSTIRDSFMVHCSPRIDTVLANVTFKYPSLQVENATVMENSTDNKLFTTSPQVFNAAVTTCGEYTSWSDGRACIPKVLRESPIFEFDDKTVFESGARYRFADYLTKYYNIIYAQRFSTYYRTPISTSPSSNVFLPSATKLEADLLDIQEYRVVQSQISTRILQALLATLSACALMAWIFTRLKKVLTKNPQSIAAVSSWLAESEMLREIPAGSELLSDKQLIDQGVLQGSTFSIGWWDEV
ncbi:Hypothetical protein D9617_5g068530 [Elsinoe fawcettii]|nr:Hypothetical protein D9617_5g068530 [Elsinoe fawcettii]